MQCNTIPSLSTVMRRALLVICVFSTLNGNQEHATHMILTMLDDSEPALFREEVDQNGRLQENLGAVATALLVALLEEQSILIVNSSVVNYLLRYLQEVSDNPLDLIPLKKINPNNWIKKKISDYLYILIPKEHSSFKNISRYEELKKNNFHMFDEQELALGIKFKSLKNINDGDFMKPLYHPDVTHYPLKEQAEEIELTRSYVTFTRGLSWISSHFIGYLDNLFISKTKYNNFLHCMPHFIVIADGHGSHYYPVTRRIQMLEKYGQEARLEIKRLKKMLSSGQVAYSGGALAGFNSKDFGAFVTFLAEHSSVKLLFFNTCYGAEVNTQEALDGIALPFAVVSGALSSGTSRIRVERETVRNDQRELKVSLTKPVFKNFFEHLAKNAIQSDEVVVKALEHIYPFVQKKDDSYNNIPSIKRPGERWKVLERPNIITFDEAFLQKQRGNPLDVSLLLENKTAMSNALAKTSPYPTVILLRTATIPCELMLSGKRSIESPAFISMLPGDTLHRFIKINAHTFLISEFFRAFFKIPDLQENKTFVIDALIVKNDMKGVLQSSEEVVHLKNVVISSEADHSTTTALLKKSIYFEYNNTGWFVVTQGENPPLVQSIKKIATPEKIKQIVYQAQLGNSKLDALMEDENRINESADDQEEVPDSTFVTIFAWVYSLFC